AKSCWDIVTDDKSRPLSRRGIKDAHLVSNAILSYLPKKFIVWSSTAVRAKQTAIIFGQNMDINLDCIVYNDELYTFDEYDLLKVIKKCKNEHNTLILFGHNDAITNFVNKFGNESFENIPTSGSVIMKFSIDNWEDICKGKIQLTIFPRDLKNNEHKYA
ncbi:SixA phosphatase family protein, partial [Myroides sp. LoEW2-1]